ncbi:MAG: uncharacterized protein QOH99_1764 [Frankiaceae bacterium]|nr:uncharacterized protein [Frankiaceae bacterium]
MTSPGSTIIVATPFGPAHLLLDGQAFAATPTAPPPAALVVIGHGASGDSDAPDILAVRDALLAAGCAVARTVQPYRVAGRRVPAPVAQLDASFALLVAEARSRVAAPVPLVVGGRSNGARVAARSASALGAAAVLALSFPLHPPGRPDRSRASELAGAGVPAFVLQGQRDTFGSPTELAAAVPGPHIHPIPGAGHSPRPGPALTEAALLASQWVLRSVRN